MFRFSRTSFIKKYIFKEFCAQEFTYTRLLERFAPRTSSISTFNCGFICELFSVYSVKENIKKFADFIIFFHAFSKFYKIKKLLIQIFEILSFINLPWGHERCHKKCGPDRFSRVDVYWIQTNRQTPRQAKFIYRLEIEGASRPSF